MKIDTKQKPRATSPEPASPALPEMLQLNNKKYK